MVITAVALTAVAVFLTATTQFCGSSFCSCLFSVTMVAAQTLAVVNVTADATQTAAANCKKGGKPPFLVNS